jgi:hypothetical protein
MQYEDDTDTTTIDTSDEEIAPLEERLNALRTPRHAAGYSAAARARIEYLQELRRLRSLVGDDRLDTF